MWVLLACTDDPGRPPVSAGGPPVADAGPDVVAFVGEPATLDGFSSRGNTFTWTFDDGLVLEGSTVVRTYDAPGHYTAVLEAADTEGRTDTDGVAITVVYPPLDPPPVNGSSITGDAERVYVVMPDFDRLAVIDRATRAVSWWDTCGTPRSVAVGPDAVWVACEEDAVDAFALDGSLLHRTVLPRGSRPFGVVPTGAAAHVTLQGTGSLATIRSDGDILRIVEIEPDLRGIAKAGTDLVVTRWRSPDLHGVAVWIDDGDDFGVAGTWPLAVAPGPDSDTASRGVPSLLARVAIRPDGRVAVFPGIRSNLERGLTRDGLPMTFETTDRADLRQVDLSTGYELAFAAFDDRDLAAAAAFSPLGDWLYVVHSGMETVDVLDALTLLKAGAVEGVGSGPDGLWAAPEGRELWVSAPLSRDVGVYDVTSVATPLPLERISVLPPSGEVLDAEVLRGRILFGRSADPRMCRNGYLSCASCHPEGDHDGRTWDFTDRGEGLRNTIPLVGRAGSAPIHWTANFDEVQDFENDIRGPMQGAGFLDDADWDLTSDTLGPSKAGLSEDLDALAAYVESLDAYPPSPFRNADGTMTADALAGEALFLDPAVGCATCHVPPEYTDSAFTGPGEPVLHDVGTLGPGSGQRLGGPLTGLDTPTLRGVWASAPYLHDGSAATLREVLVDRNPDDRHGVVSILPPGEVDRLVAFLLQVE